MMNTKGSVTEIDVPEGYIKNNGEWHVELFPGKDSELVVTNDRKSDLTIRKTDKDTGEAVPGVTFTLSKVDGATITTESTKKDGTVTISRLEPGVYTVTEQSVPEGYILDTTPQMVTIFPNRNASVHFQNYKRPTLTISKVDLNGNALPGAIFEVKTKDGVKIGDYPVDKNGKVTMPSIMPAVWRWTSTAMCRTTCSTRTPTFPSRHPSSADSLLILILPMSLLSLIPPALICVSSNWRRAPTSLWRVLSLKSSIPTVM